MLLFFNKTEKILSANFYIPSLGKSGYNTQSARAVVNHFFRESEMRSELG